MRSGWIIGVLIACLLAATSASAEGGYDLWLRYRPLPPTSAATVRAHAGAIVTQEADPRIASAKAELIRAVEGLAGTAPTSDAVMRPGAILLGTPARSPLVRQLGLPLAGLGNEGYVIRSVVIAGSPTIVVAANDGAGVLYGAFALIRHLQRGDPIDRIALQSRPEVGLRVLNHWDNLDRQVERGYAGQSIWDWWRLPGQTDARYTDYARANASIGINGAVLNNVNAKADSLTTPYIAKAAAVADVLRPWGMKVYLSARFSAPIELGGLKTADPLDPAVARWWRGKADEIYRAIPDFGGFLVKANSEGQPGPRDYRRSHADGANMLAAAVAPHGGVVMWRAFVYADTDPEDRAKQAYTEFKPLDGRFADNVIVQVKNGPIDFQPREPFHPLFGAMPKTPLMIEFQITKEYLGFATHLAYLGPLFAETLAADTYGKGRGSTVARVIDGSLDGHRLTGMAGVANIGTDRNWAGSIFDQANWYAFGRLAWDPRAKPDAIAADWAAATFTPDPRFLAPTVAAMMRSREAVVDYMTPLGLAHLMATGHHYGPGPWVADLARPEWNPVYYHRADANGIGFDRTRTGSNALAQYAPPVASRFADPKTIDEQYLLWFHHVPWDHRMADGATLWDTLVRRYDRGVAQVADTRDTWARLKPFVDAERHGRTADALRVQLEEAQWWRDASIAYFASLSRRPLPAGLPPPAHPLDWYKAQRFPWAPGNPQ
ncbi:alpha-glucuronidase family glycosyl hydrolase [Sphingomonas radiodurans]|uniref:alpha-glucuronidase family glycosyl hydrolase n=1 Tax=Sphingomonas radiodurans TaxID=2890321 RepID=UPI001E6159B9|nr:alpha-glucuronidase family glycosyl hydrolase [Sphingomonas radiodurans]WBH15535.1 alpha-glucuronidase family glycosyl hydrolase [Sphingomonas radiodurans]